MALIGIAFSIAFLIGPMIGVGFSMWAKAQIAKSEANEAWFAYPAAVALALALIDLVYLYMAFKETLPPEKRLKDLKAAINQAFSYINPISLFSFATLKNSGGVTAAELASLITLGRSYFLYLFLYSGLEFTLTFLTHLRFGFTSMDQGKMFLFIGTLMSIIQDDFKGLIETLKNIDPEINIPTKKKYSSVEIIQSIKYLKNCESCKYYIIKC